MIPPPHAFIRVTTDISTCDLAVTIYRELINELAGSRVSCRLSLKQKLELNDIRSTGPADRGPIPITSTGEFAVTKDSLILHN